MSEQGKGRKDIFRIVMSELDLANEEAFCKPVSTSPRASITTFLCCDQSLSIRNKHLPLLLRTDWGKQRLK